MWLACTQAAGKYRLSVRLCEWENQLTAASCCWLATNCLPHVDLIAVSPHT